MKCQLCLEEKQLIKRSHIIPKFMFHDLVNSGEKFAEVNIDDLSDSRRVSNSPYSKYILCPKCDNELLGKYETYASRVLYHGFTENASDQVLSRNCVGDDGLHYMEVLNLDYSKFKLFLLSILWRAHLSDHKLFNQINLGPHAENLRKMILEGNAGRTDRYEVSVVALDTEKSPVKSVIGPRRLLENSNTSYVFHINRVMYLFNVSNYSKSDFYTKGWDEKFHIFNIPILKGHEADVFFDSFIKRKLRLKSKL